MLQLVLLQQRLLPLLDADGPGYSGLAGFRLDGPVDDLILGLREPDFERVQLLLRLHLGFLQAGRARQIGLLLFLGHIRCLAHLEANF